MNICQFVVHGCIGTLYKDIKHNNQKVPERKYSVKKHEKKKEKKKLIAEDLGIQQPTFPVMLKHWLSKQPQRDLQLGRVAKCLECVLKKNREKGKGVEGGDKSKRE